MLAAGKKYSSFKMALPTVVPPATDTQRTSHDHRNCPDKSRPEDHPTVRHAAGRYRGSFAVYSVSGEWDLVALVEVTDYEGVASVVTEHISAVPGLRNTQTLTAFRAYSKKDLEQAWDIGLE